ncbi:hypothetical protein ACFRU3_45420 [Streptomyces sp. NPDC056910]|uniref:hypothetical protein n=1 Tax=unclassified Streptomyces TaxID=2593676 RepID=UPI00368F89AC
MSAELVDLLVLGGELRQDSLLEVGQVLDRRGLLGKAVLQGFVGGFQPVNLGVLGSGMSPAS